MAIEVDTKVKAIEHVNELPGGWLVEEWLPIQEEEAQSLSKTLWPRVANILKGDKAELESLMHPKGYWRDMVSLSWTFRTFHEKE